MTNHTRRSLLGAAAGLPFARLLAEADETPSWHGSLEGIRVRYGLPALGAAIVSGGGLVAASVTGVRKKGSDVAAKIDDLWHLGSNTKAMTSTLAAVAVEAGRIRWDSTVAEVFPKEKNIKKSPLAGATLTHLLSHWSGLPANPSWPVVVRLGDDVISQRGGALRMALELTDLPVPGGTHLYSNWGYTIAGHMLEETMDLSWEELMRRAIFSKLGIETAGFGGTGTPGKIDQPWPHGKDGNPIPKNGPTVDNLPPLGPAGTVHMSLADWAGFIADQLAGRAGKGKLLKTAGYEHLHTAAQPGEPYALGWLDLERSWGGRVVSHNGSNTMNYSVAWLAPEKDFAMIACTNQGSEDCRKALDDVAGLLIGEGL